MASQASCSSETFDALQEAAAAAFPAGSFGATLAAKLSQQKADAIRAKAEKAADYKARKHSVYDTERALRRALDDHERARQFEAPSWAEAFPVEESPGSWAGGSTAQRRFSSHHARI